METNRIVIGFKPIKKHLRIVIDSEDDVIVEEYVEAGFSQRYDKVYSSQYKGIEGVIDAKEWINKNAV